MNITKKNFWLLPSTILLAAACGSDDPKDAADAGDETGCDNGVCVLSGTITDDTTLTADKEWLLRGGVFIGDDAEETILTIEPGTTIYGETSTQGMLVVRRGSKLIAEGTAAEPIVFTSSKEAGKRARGDWGGLIINGRAPVNGCDNAPCESFGEGGTGYYGGSDAADSSGVLKYVSVQFAGRLVSPDNELNGIAFQGVGSGTEVDYVQVHMNKDDGVEFFGGSVNVKHLVLTGIADDSMDWTDGWSGNAQFVCIQQYDDTSDNGIEADNNGENNNSLPRSNPTLSNFTIIGSPNSDASDLGLLLREGTAVKIHNTIVTDFNDACLDIDDDATFNQVTGGSLGISNSMMSCATNFKEEAGDPQTLESIFNAGNGNVIADPELNDPHKAANPDYNLGPNSPARTGGVSPAGNFFETASYLGCIDPANDWTQGWTTHERQ